MSTRVVRPERERCNHRYEGAVGGVVQSGENPKRVKRKKERERPKGAKERKAYRMPEASGSVRIPTGVGRLVER